MEKKKKIPLPPQSYKGMNTCNFHMKERSSSNFYFNDVNGRSNFICVYVPEQKVIPNHEEYTEVIQMRLKKSLG